MTNTAAFTGGADAQQNAVIKQTDIDNAATPLEKTEQQILNNQLISQKSSNEQVVSSTFACTPTVTTDHNAGDTAKAVNVSVATTCNEDAYDNTGALNLGQTLLKMQVQNTPSLPTTCKLEQYKFR